MDAAVREIQEETGLDAAGALRPADYRYELRKEEAEEWSASSWERLYGPHVRVVTEEVFSADAPAGWEPALSWEHDEYRWCPLDEALELLRYEENKEGLRAAARSVRSG